jgi:endonuclease-3 related protein
MSSRLLSAEAVRRVCRLLLACYGPQGWWPLLSRAGEPGYDENGYHPGDYGLPVRREERFEIAAGAILTQNTSWINVRRALRALLDAGMLSPEAVIDAEQAELARLIRPSGYFNQKARKMKSFARYFRRRAEMKGEAEPPGREELLGLWGIGPETADSILLYAYGLPLFVVDAYTRRLAARLAGVQVSGGYAAVQETFVAGLPVEPGEARRLSGEYHALIVAHAKERCTARDPRCSGCPLAEECRWGRTGL